MNAAGERRLTRGLLTGVVIVGSLALWTAVPIGWMYFTSDLVTDQGGRFVLVIFGVPWSIALGFMLLSWADSYRRRLNPVPEPTSDNERSKGHSLLEVMLVASGAVALVALVLWWFFIADTANPSGPLQPI